MDLPASLPEIVIVAPSLGDAARDEAYAIERIDTRQAANAPRLDETLSASPSASLFRRSSSLTANASIQGASLRAIAPSGAGRALVMLEGAPINDPFGGWVIWSAIPAETIAAIDIVRGAGAGPYGAGALTGVINLREAEAPNALNATFGERGYARAAAAWSGAGISFAASGERFEGDVPVRAGRSAADVAADFESFAASARWLADLASGRASLRLGLYDETRGAGLVGAESQSRGAHVSAAYAQNNDASGWRVQGWAALTDFANSSASIAADRMSATPAANQYETPAFGAGANLAYRARGESLEWEIGADARYAEGESREHFRNLGAGFTRGRIAGGASVVLGAYGEASFETGAWLFAGGVRADYSAAFDARRYEYDLATSAATLNETPGDADEIVPSARLGVRRDLGAIDLRAAAYAGFRPPTLNELHRPFRVGNDVTEANAALQSERLAGAEIGASGESWSATLFYNRLDDAIGNVTLGAGPGAFPRVGFLLAGSVYRQRQNLGRIEAWGFEADARWRFEALDLRAAIAATDAEVTRAPAAPQLEGLRPAQAPDLTATFGAQWRIHADWSLALDARWESARWEDDLNTRRLSAGLNADARLSWAFTHRASLDLAVENLLDEALEVGETAAGVESFAPARIISIGISLR
ncbi:MAG TPA: TonB-dependent receptor [Terricaulis sp.]|nr:TonB-dependent receptor [Terricaulis sp.]